MVDHPVRILHARYSVEMDLVLDHLFPESVLDTFGIPVTRFVYVDFVRIIMKQ